MTIARLYGNSLLQTSLAVVTEGFRSALEKSDALAGVHYLDSPGDPDFEPAMGPGWDAPIGIFVGAISAAHKLALLGRHRHCFIMVTPNSNRLPGDLVKSLGELRKKQPVTFMAPSGWAATTVASYLDQCLTVPHGVSPEYHVREELSRRATETYRNGDFNAIHFSTSDRQRKGTLELLRAWDLVGGKGKLLCVLDHHAYTALMDEMGDEGVRIPPGVRFINRVSATPENLATMLSAAHVLVQPSRGEGFGLLPLQALCAGVPVVATNVTGHSEYMRQAPIGGLVVVPTRPLAPIDDLPGATAPGLKHEDIAGALEYARARYLIIQEKALAEAPDWQKRWSWDAALSSFILNLKALP